MPLRAARARSLGATREEVIGAVLVGVRASGRANTERLRPELEAIDAPAWAEPA